MRIAFAGTTEFAVACLEALKRDNIDISLVITQPDRVAGRNRRLTAPPVKVWALGQGLNVWQPTRINCPESRDYLAGFAPDLLVVVAYGRILKKDILDVPRLGAVNVHTSLLPDLRGAAPIEWALLRGLKQTGITTMYMDEGLDTGDIILQAQTPIFPEDNRETLEGRLADLARTLLPETVALIRAGEAPREPQSPGEWVYAPPLANAQEQINWADSAEQIFNQVRAFSPTPGAYTTFRGKRLKILKARVVPGASSPGRVLVMERELAVGTGAGLLVLELIQPEGKKQMDARSFANGYRVTEGEQLQ